MSDTDKNQQLRQRIRLLEEALGQEREAKRQKEEHIASLEELQNGTFYSRFSLVWSGEPVCYQNRNDPDSDPDYMGVMTRENAPSWTINSSKDKNILSPYQVTLAKARDVSTTAKDDTSSARTSHSSINSKAEIWSVDVFNKKKTRDAQIAHLVPASPAYASLYYHVAKWVFGDKETLDAENQRLVKKLIHGASENGGAISGKGKRIKGTGLKHLACNKVCIRGQATYFDLSPCLLIVPILGLQKAKDWNGEGYDAVVMIDDNTNASDLKEVAAGVGMQEGGDEATPAEIEMARCLLRTTLPALAQSLAWLYTNKDSPGLLTNTAKGLVTTYMKNILGLDGSHTVTLPKINDSCPELRVRKITFVSVNGDSAGHPAPDPILLAVKAGVVWSKFHNEQLLAGGEVTENGDMDSGDILAEEEFLEWRGSIQRRMAIPREISIPTGN